MQISVENTGGLGRKINLTIPIEQINQKISKKIHDLSKKVQLNGFRKGHVPVKLIKDKYSASIRQEVLGDSIDSGLNQAIKTNQLSPLGEVTLEKIKDELNQDIQCTFVLRVYPEVKFNDFAELEIKNYQVKISESEIEDGVKLVREKFGKTISVDRSAKLGDLLTLDYTGLLDGKEFSGGSAKDAKLELGSEQFIEGFESGLIGVTAGDRKDLELKFPDDYPEASLAGKAVVFTIDVKQVAEKQLAGLDQDLAKSLNIELNSDHEEASQIKERVVSNMQQYAEKIINDKQSAETIQALLKAYPIDELPDELVTDEQARLEQEFKNLNLQQGIEIKVLTDTVSANIRKQARDNVHLSLLLRQIIKQNNLTIDEKLFAQNMQQFDLLFYNVPKNKKHQDLYTKIQNSVINSTLKEQALKFVLDKTTKTEQEISFKELTKTN